MKFPRTNDRGSGSLSCRITYDTRNVSATSVPYCIPTCHVCSCLKDLYRFLCPGLMQRITCECWGFRSRYYEERARSWLRKGAVRMKVRCAPAGVWKGTLPRSALSLHGGWREYYDCVLDLFEHRDYGSRLCPLFT